MPRSMPTSSGILPHPGPDCPHERLLLFAFRRMAGGGLADAQAAHAMFTACGLRFRRPLVLLRALMAEVQRVAARRLLVAPCCCPRMTGDEAVLMDAIARAVVRPAAAHAALSRLLGVRTCLGVVTTAQAVAASFADTGLPLDALADG